MARKRIILVCAVLVAFLVLYNLYGGSVVPKGQLPLVRLNDSNLSSLKDAFNNSANSVRVLVMLSPT